LPFPHSYFFAGGKLNWNGRQKREVGLPLRKGSWRDSNTKGASPYNPSKRNGEAQILYVLDPPSRSRTNPHRFEEKL